MKKKSRIIILSAWLAVFLLAAEILLPISAYAAGSVSSVPSLSVSKLTIGIGTSGSPGTYSWGYPVSKYQIMVLNSINGAVYSFTSSNKKVAGVRKDGATAFLTGRKAGSAVITCRQKYKGNTITIGTCKVTVKKSKLLYQEGMPAKAGLVNLGRGRTVLNYAYQPYIVAYRNHKADYSYEADSDGLKVREIRSMENGMVSYSVIYDAADTGTYQVTVREAYGQSSRTVGSFTVVIHEPQVSSEYKLKAGNTIPWYVLVEYPADGVRYFLEAEEQEQTVVSFQEAVTADDVLKIYGESPGLVMISVYAEEEKQTLLGTCRLIVEN